MALLLAIALCTGCTREVTSYVNPFVGTDFHGHTFPGAIYPFGQIQPGPDTRLEGWDGCSGYHYSDDTLYGFSHTHLNGTGCADLCDILLMPVNGDAPKQLTREQYLSTFSHSNENAEPGYYSVKMDNGIRVELTCNERVAYHRYTFADKGKKGFIIDLTHRDKLIDGGFVVDLGGNEESDDNESANRLLIGGWRTSDAWNPDQHCYFVVSTEDVSQEEIVCYDAEGNVTNRDDSAAVKLYVPLPNDSSSVTLLVAISGVDQRGAAMNLCNRNEQTFDEVRKSTHNKWEETLSKIMVNGGSNVEKQNFYTALYHCYTSPYLWSDFDGRYRGQDGNIYHIDSLPEHPKNLYTVFSLWDTYRALHPLMTLLEPEITKDWIATMLMHYETGGELTMWELHGYETHCMIGYHACPVILDAYQHHLLDDWPTERLEKLLEAMVATSNRTEAHRAYGERGYLDSQTDNESVSKTLEYSFDDWCIAQFAKEIMKKDEEQKTKVDSIYNHYIVRSQSWQHLMDTNGFMHARRNGAFVTPFDPTEVNNHYTEANSWQYSSYVPHDIPGWVELMGGREKAIAFLDQLFSVSSETSGRKQVDITGLIGQYAHGNEPSHHAAYLYNYLDQPEKSNQLVHRIMSELYTPKPDGLCGNEDCGQMSAWYVLSALGFYPVCPGSGEYTTVKPTFKKAVLHLVEGDITIDRDSWPTGKFWRDGTFYDESISGKDFEMGRLTPTPYFNDWQQRFDGSRTIELKDLCADAEIRYTIDGGQEQKYTAPFTIDKDAVISAVAYHPKRRPSAMTTQRLTRFEADKKVSYLTEPATQYYENGPEGLVDRLYGTSNYKIGGWQGWTEDMEIVVDLLQEQTIHSVGVDCLEHMRSWIFFPRCITVETSTDGEHFNQIGTVENNRYAAVRARQEECNTETFTLNKTMKTRYLRIKAKNYGAMPSWHTSAGEQAWLFVDEIEVK